MPRNVVYFVFFPEEGHTLQQKYLARFIRVRFEPESFFVTINIVFALGRVSTQSDLAPVVIDRSRAQSPKPVHRILKLPQHRMRRYTWVRYDTVLPRPVVDDGPFIYSPFIPKPGADEPPPVTPLMNRLGVSSILAYARERSSPAWEDAFLFGAPKYRPPMAHDPESFIYLKTFHKSDIDQYEFAISTFDLDGNEGPIVTLQRKTF